MKELFHNKKILITGHTSFQGSWLSFILKKWGARIAGVSLPPHTCPNLFEALNIKDSIDHYSIDIRDRRRLFEVFQKEKPGIVFHLAAQAIVRKSYDEPLETYQINALGTANVLQCIKDCESVRAAVIVTTDKVYKNQERTKPYTETDHLGGFDPYSASKAAADIITQSYISSFFNPEHYGSVHQVLVAIARSGNVIGGGDWAEDRLIPDIIRAVFHKNSVLQVRNPTAVRPWQHVLEPLLGYLKLAHELYLGRTEIVGAYNFGPSHTNSCSVEEVVKMATTFLGEGLYIIASDTSKHETEYLALDISKAKKILGWHPRLSLEDSLRWTIEWYKTYYKDRDSISIITNEQIHKFFV